MFGLTRWARGGVTGVIVVATTIGVGAVGTPPTTAQADECYERYVGAPINEQGIQCPGDPSIWKSFTFASNGFGYYTETEDLPDGRALVRLGYRHQDGRVAISILECTAAGCVERESNGVPFPFQS